MSKKDKPIYLKRNAVARDVRTPKYKMQVIPDKKALDDKRKCRGKQSDEIHFESD